MLDTPSNAIGDVRVQSFDISYEYPVVFTRDAFSSGNRSLIDALSRREGDKLHRCGIFVDEGVLAALPELADQISTYASFHAKHLKIVGKLVPVAGGERCKNDPEMISSAVSSFPSGVRAPRARIWSPIWT